MHPLFKFFSKRKFNLSVTELLILIFLSIIVGTAIVYFTLKAMDLLHEQGAVIAGLGDVVVGAIAALAIVYQLNRVKVAEQKVHEVEESRFILQYNQVFIQDKNMCNIQSKLEKYMLGRMPGPIIDDENRQSLINYLVYLEGLAPLIFKKVLTIETIDDLLAYRFFLGMNNKEVQKDQLLAFPDYYKGCFRLYNHWKKYRDSKGLEILQKENSLDAWWGFDKYINTEIIIRKCNDTDSLERIAELIYHTDKYIYPAAFGSVKNAKIMLPELMKEDHNIFSKKNLQIAIYNERIVGVSIALTFDNYAEIGQGFIEKYRDIAPHFEDVCTRYFNKFTEKHFSVAPYILCLFVDEKYRKKKIGKILLIDLLIDYHSKDVTLHVLEQYDSSERVEENPAIALYKKLGFHSINKGKGYALNPERAPVCIEMKRDASL